MLSTSTISQSYSKALASPHTSQWKCAIQEECEYLLQNDTRTLSNLPFGRKAVNCKWVYALKTKPDGTVDCFKARLVAKGSQKFGINFYENYSPILKFDSIRLVLTITEREDIHMAI